MSFELLPLLSEDKNIQKHEGIILIQIGDIVLTERKTEIQHTTSLVQMDQGSYIGVEV